MKKLIIALALLMSVPAVAGKKATLGGFDGFVERMGAGTRELGRGNTMRNFSYIHKRIDFVRLHRK